MSEPITTTPVALADWAVREPDQLCLVDAETGEGTTFAELHRDSLLVADRLHARGVRAGDHVATLLPHSIDTYRVWFALAWLRALEVPISTRHRGHMIEHLLRDSAATLLIAGDEQLSNVRSVLSERVPDLSVMRPSELRSSPAAGERRQRPPHTAPRAHDVAMVLYTSGTTGPAKGVLVPWGQVHATTTGAFPPRTMDRTKVVYAPFPPNHIGGRLFACLGIAHGIPTVLRHTFSASSFWPDIEAHGCTTVGLVSAMASILLRSPERPGEADSTLTDVLMVPLIPDHAAFARRFGVRVCTSYNMTEVSIPIVSDWSPTDWRSCGVVRPGPPYYECRVVDEQDRPLAPGQVGELVCRTGTPWAMNVGYLGRPEPTVSAWRNGWFHTGDAFRHDENGRYFFVDRRADTIRRRGENISSAEVEREVLDHPGVAQCAAIGVASELGEEDIKVFVVRQPDSTLSEGELLAFVAGRAATFLVPTFVEFVDALPMTEGTDRVRKTLLREREAHSDSRSL